MLCTNPDRNTAFLIFRSKMDSPSIQDESTGNNLSTTIWFQSKTLFSAKLVDKGLTSSEKLTNQKVPYDVAT